jgi:hypothetical protein
MTVRLIRRADHRGLAGTRHPWVSLPPDTPRDGQAQRIAEALKLANKVLMSVDP